MNKVEEILKLKTSGDVMILAHHYQSEAVKAIADHVGDSLEMARVAAKSPSKTLVICGVYFMAETAKLLSPEKTVLIPRTDAGCPMADMVTAQRLKEEKGDLPVVCYVNSSAEVKALSDICCTSSNAVKVVKALGAKEALFVPDQNLASYVQSMVPEVKIKPWRGFCPTHHRMTEEDVLMMRKRHPEAYFMAHPECAKEVLAHADFIGSTSQIIDQSTRVLSHTLVIGTEDGVIETIRKRNPDKTVMILDHCMVCPNMKKTRIEDVLHVLRTGENAVEVADEVAEKARIAISRMMDVK